MSNPADVIDTAHASTTTWPLPSRPEHRAWSPEHTATLAGFGWAVAVGLALVVGTHTVATWPEARLRAAPLFGDWGVELALGGLAVLPAVVMAALTVTHGPSLAARLPWRTLVVVAGGATVVWSIALAATAGWSQVAAPLDGRFEYLAVLDRIDSPSEFLRTFTERAVDYPIHVKGHPPGMPLLLWGMDRIGLGGVGWAAALVLVGAGAAVAATLVTLRDVAGEELARRAAPFVAVAPMALWLGTSADAWFAGVGAIGCALVIVGRRPATQLAGGIVLGLTVFLSYGAALLGLVPLAVALRRRDLRPVLRAAVGTSAVFVAFAAAGFWWFDGLETTRGFYWDGVASHRPTPVFTFVTNPSALALATGPAVAAGFAVLLTRSRAARFAPPVGGAGNETTGVAAVALAGLAAVAAASLSALSKGEVERIWLPFMLWMLCATALLPPRQQRAWLAAQVTVALAIEVALRGSW